MSVKVIRSTAIIIAISTVLGIFTCVPMPVSAATPDLRIVVDYNAYAFYATGSRVEQICSGGEVGVSAGIDTSLSYSANWSKTSNVGVVIPYWSEVNYFGYGDRTVRGIPQVNISPVSWKQTWVPIYLKGPYGYDQYILVGWGTQYYYIDRYSVYNPKNK